MTDEQQGVINQLRDEGYCVILWTPEELDGVHVDYLEDVVIERGNDFIASSK